MMRRFSSHGKPLAALLLQLQSTSLSSESAALTNNTTLSPPHICPSGNDVVLHGYQQLQHLQHPQRRGFKTSTLQRAPKKKGSDAAAVAVATPDGCASSQAVSLAGAATAHTHHSTNPTTTTTTTACTEPPVNLSGVLLPAHIAAPLAAAARAHGYASNLWLTEANLKATGQWPPAPSAGAPTTVSMAAPTTKTTATTSSSSKTGRQLNFYNADQVAFYSPRAMGGPFRGPPEWLGALAAAAKARNTQCPYWLTLSQAWTFGWRLKHPTKAATSAEAATADASIPAAASGDTEGDSNTDAAPAAVITDTAATTPAAPPAVGVLLPAYTPASATSHKKDKKKATASDAAPSTATSESVQHKCRSMMVFNGEDFTCTAAELEETDRRMSAATALLNPNDNNSAANTNRFYSGRRAEFVSISTLRPYATLQQLEMADFCLAVGLTAPGQVWGTRKAFERKGLCVIADAPPLAIVLSSGDVFELFNSAHTDDPAAAELYYRAEKQAQREAQREQKKRQAAGSPLEPSASVGAVDAAHSEALDAEANAEASPVHADDAETANAEATS